MLETSKVPGTSVYSGAQEEIGAVDDLIVDTVSGKVRYAILRFSGTSRAWKKSVRHPVDRAQVGPIATWLRNRRHGRPAEDVPGPRPTFTAQSQLRAASPHRLRSTELLGARDAVSLGRRSPDRK